MADAGIANRGGFMPALSRRDIVAGLAAAGAGAVVGIPAIHGLAVAASAQTPVELTGRLVFPTDPGYDVARQLWDRIFVTYPLVVVYCEKPDDVRNAVAWCRENGVTLRARSGGHSLEGWSSVDGGVVIDVSRLKQVSIDKTAGLATVGTGLTQGEAVAAFGAEGFAIPTGSEASVGLGGVTLGGGIGLLSRSLGVTCDSLVGVDMVVPDGARGAKLIHVDEQENADLLWACRGGGGGNFGIATAFTFRVHAIGPVAPFKVTWDWSDPAAAFNAWQSFAPTADNRFGSTFVFLPRAANAVEAEGVFTGSADEARALLAPLIGAGNPQVTVSDTSWPEHFVAINPPGRSFANWRFSSSWAYEALPKEALDVIVEFMSDAPAPACNYWCLSWGGATRTEPPGGSAFFHRDPLYYAEPGAGWNDASQTGPVAVWLARFRQAMRPFVRGAYVNVPDAALGDWGEAYYGPNFARLREVKRLYDPTEVFRFPQSIPPA
jgi:FAD/FMN-containing dehydrogenase